MRNQQEPGLFTNAHMFARASFCHYLFENPSLQWRASLFHSSALGLLAVFSKLLPWAPRFDDPHTACFDLFIQSFATTSRWIFYAPQLVVIGVLAPQHTLAHAVTRSPD